MNNLTHLKNKMPHIGILILLMALLPKLAFSQAGWEHIYYEEESSTLSNLIVNADGENLLVHARGEAQNGNDFVMKYNAVGDLIWDREFIGTFHTVEIAQPHNGENIAVRIEAVNGENRPVFFKFGPNGNSIWETVGNAVTVSSFLGLSTQTDGSVAMLQGNLTSVLFSKVSSDGTIEVEQLELPFDDASNLLPYEDQKYLLFTPNANDEQQIVTLSPTGEVLSIQNFPTIPASYGLHGILPDGNVAILQPAANAISLVNIDLEANNFNSVVLSSSDSPFITDISLVNDGIIYAGSITGVDIISKIDWAGNSIWQTELNHLPGSLSLWSGTGMPDGGVACSGVFYPLSTDFAKKSYTVRLNADGELFSNAIAGSVSIDLNDNCLIEAEDTPLNGFLVTAQDGTTAYNFAATTDAQGNYNIPVYPGDYVVSISPPSPLWDPCDNNIPVSLPDVGIDTLVDFAFNADILCPNMVVNHSVPTIRACFERLSYVHYCNTGTDTAYLAYIDISYDSLITPVSSSIPMIDLGDNTFRFELDTVAPLECGDFSVSLFLDCDAETGASYCITTHIFPDTSCIAPLPTWSGALLSASGRCEDGNAYLQLTNVGDQDMQDFSDYIIVEDIFLLELDSVNLNMGAFAEFPLPANGSTYTLIAEQVANAPGAMYPTAVIEGCGENEDGEFSIGFANQFPLGDGDTFIDIDCPIAVNAFDPNDKQGFPLGYDDEHFILPETPIEYMIRFQNTGNDTAYTVILRDTLDANFDLRTLAAGASSHPYQTEIEGQGILKFTFHNINLPDSIVNEPNSHGFVEFVITPKAETPLGTQLKNKAGIYFDFNEPIITNETFHTLGVDFIEIVNDVIEHPTLSTIEALIQPNPFSESTTIYLSNHVANEYQLEIYSADGKMIRGEKHNSNPIFFERKNMAEGLYFIRITSSDGLNYAGRLMIH